MYTLEDLQQKSLKELKEIGEQLNVLPDGDRRYSNNWIEAIIGVNPPLLALLETSPADVQARKPPIIEMVEASPAAENVQAQEPPIESKFGRIVYPRPAQGATSQVAENTPGVEVDPIQGAIETQSKSDCPTCKAADSLHLAYDCCLEMWFVQCLHCDYHRPMNRSSNYLAVPDPALNLFGILPYKHQLLKRLELQATEANEFPAPAHARFQVGDLVKSVGQRWGISPDLTGEVVALNPSGGLFVYFGPAAGHRDYSRFESKDLIKLEPIEKVQAQEPIAKAAKIPPGVEWVDTEPPDPNDYEFREEYYERYKDWAAGAIEIESEQLDVLPECSYCFGDGYVEDEFGSIKFCQCQPKVSHKKTQSAIAPAAKTSKSDKSDQNPILTGLRLSDRFLARYSPPQSESLHYEITDGYKVDTDGQLSLFEVQVVTAPEPPDPDDFDSMFAFWAAYDAWDKATDDDGEPSSIDKLLSSIHKLPSSIHKLPSSIYKLPSSIHKLPSSIDKLPSSIDKLPSSIDALEISLDSFIEWAPCPPDWYEPSQVMEHLRASDSSNTSDFFIPTFGAWCDRANRQADTDEPPDTGIFARLPGPKPPRFPPQVGHKSDTSRTQGCKSARHPETIPKLFSVAAGTSTQPARSPPGGDANFA